MTSFCPAHVFTQMCDAVGVATPSMTHKKLNDSLHDEFIGWTEHNALAAAAANDDYEALGSASKAFSESLVVGSEDLAQSAWANVAQICSDLFEPSIWR